MGGACKRWKNGQGLGTKLHCRFKSHQLPRKNYPGHFLVVLPRKILKARGMHDNVGAVQVQNRYLTNYALLTTLIYGRAYDRHTTTETLKHDHVEFSAT